MLLWLTGRKVVKVNAMGRKVFSKHWDYVTAQLLLDDGTVVSLENSWVMPQQRLAGMDGGMTVMGAKGMMEVNFVPNEVRSTTGELGRTMHLDCFNWAVVGDIPTGTLRSEVEAFVRAVQNNQPPPVTGEQATEAVRVIEWIERELDKQD